MNRPPTPRRSPSLPGSIPRFAFAAFLAVLTLSAGCARIGVGGGGGGAGSGGGPIPRVDGAWTGLVSIEDQGIGARLTLRQEADRLFAVLDAPDVGLRAEGEGRITAGGQVFITLAYDLQCPGSAELEGRRSADGLVLDGSVVAEDCTGRSTGGFSFRR